MNVASTEGLVSLVVASCNQKERLENSLLSLRRQVGVSYEVVGVDAGSCDGSLDVLREWSREDSGRFRVLEAPHSITPTAAVNLGAEEAKGDILVFLHADFILVPDFCLRTARAYVSRPGRVLITGLWKPLSFVPSPDEAGNVLSWMDSGLGPTFSEERTFSRGCIRDPWWMSAAHALVSIKKEHWSGWDEDLPSVYPEWAWAYQLAQAGFEFYWCPLMLGFHQYHARRDPRRDEASRQVFIDSTHTLEVKLGLPFDKIAREVR